jgi:glycosyltransferase involved in cell wall biosynthesis
MQAQLAAAAAACELELRVVSDVFPQLAGVRVVPLPWSAATETAELAQSDVGISWLPDDRWSRGKCGLKVLQYMAAGLPVVANRVGVHREMVVDGVTGFLADTPDEWVQALRRLSQDVALRAAMGAAARRRVEAEYSVEGWKAPFAAAIDALVARPAVSRLLARRDAEKQWGLSA